jgi:hypothetical protein
VIVRFRRSRGDERQQLKWFAYAVAVMVFLFLFWFSLALAGLVPPRRAAVDRPPPRAPRGRGRGRPPLRLYEIDRIINRTLVYGLLTAVLALVYAGSVVALQRIFIAFTGEDSQLAVVASTAGHSRALQPLEGPHSRLYRPALLPAQVRRGQDVGNL